MLPARCKPPRPRARRPATPPCQLWGPSLQHKPICDPCPLPCSLPLVPSRHSSTVSVVSSDAHFEWPQGPAAAQSHGTGTAPPSNVRAAEPPAWAGSRPAAPGPACAHPLGPEARGALSQNTWQQQQAAGAAVPRGPAPGDAASLQLLPPETTAALVASGLLPNPAMPGLAGYRTLGYAVQPVEVEVEGQRLQLCAVHAVFDVNGQPMLCAQVGPARGRAPRLRGHQGAAGAAKQRNGVGWQLCWQAHRGFPWLTPSLQPVAVTQQVPGCIPPVAMPATAPAAQPPSQPAPCCPPGSNLDEGTSAPILPLLARMLQQQS